MEQGKIRALRLKNSLTQDEMAEALHISQNSYSLIEAGKTRLIDMERIGIMAGKFKLSSKEFLQEIVSTDNLKEKNIRKNKIIKELLHQLEAKDKIIEKLVSDNSQLIHALINEKS